MFYELLFYIPLVNIINLGIFMLLEYISDQKMFVDNMKNYFVRTTLWSIEKYNDCKDLFMTHVYPHIRPYFEKEQERFVYFDKEELSPIYSNNIPKHVRDNLSSYTIFNAICDADERNETVKYVFKEVSDEDTIDGLENGSLVFTPHLETPLIQFELHNDGSVYDIGNTIKPYLMEGNRLSREFFEYIVLRYHNADIRHKEYTIKLMDSNVNTNEYSHTDEILIGFNEYTIEHDD